MLGKWKKVNRTGYKNLNDVIKDNTVILYYLWILLYQPKKMADISDKGCQIIVDENWVSGLGTWQHFG